MGRGGVSGDVLAAVVLADGNGNNNNDKRRSIGLG
jgi:hypothetical protein